MTSQWRSLKTEYGFNLEKNRLETINQSIFYPTRKCKNRKSIESENNYAAKLTTAMVTFFVTLRFAFFKLLQHRSLVDQTLVCQVRG